MTPATQLQNPSTPQLDPDLLNAAYSPTVRKTVRGGDRLQGVKPELLDHWNSLQDEFSKAGLTPELKSGFRTAAQQNALFRNPATAARTKGHDGYVSISPHQRGEALDISFPATQRARGRSIIADYAKRNGLAIPSDEPWHLGLTPQAKPALDPDLLNAGQQTQSTPRLDPDLMKAAYGEVPKPQIQRAKPKVWRGGTIGQGVNAGPAAGISQASVTGEASPSDATKGRQLIRKFQPLTTALTAGIMPSNVLPAETSDFVNQMVAEGAAGLLQRGAGLALQAPGTMMGTGAPVAEKLREGAAQIGRGSQAIDQDTQRANVNVPVVGNVSTKDVQNVGSGAIASAPALVLQRLGVPAPIAFGLDAYLASTGRGDELSAALKEAGLGVATGGLYEIPLPQAAKATALRQVGAKLGLGAAGGYGLAKAFGVPEAEARKNAAITALFMGSGVDAKPEMRESIQTVPEPLQARLRNAELGLREGANESQTQTQSNVTPQPESAQPAEIMARLGVPRATEEPPRTITRESVPESAAGVSEPDRPDIISTSESPRHVDLQRRLDDGTFGKETNAEKESRQAQVNPAERTNTPLQTSTEVPLQPTAVEPVKPSVPEPATTSPLNATTGSTSPEVPNRRLADRRVVKGEPPDVNAEQRAKIEQQGSRPAAKSTPILDRELGIGKTGQVYSVRTFISRIPLGDLNKIAELDTGDFSHLSTESAHQRAFDRLWKSLTQDTRDSLSALWAVTENTRQEPVLPLDIRKAVIEQLASKDTARTEVDQELARLAPSRPERRQSERRVAAPKVEGEVSVPQLSAEEVTTLPLGFKRAQPTKPEGSQWLLYRNPAGEVVGRGALEGDQIVGLEVLPEARRQGNGAAILDDLIQRGGREAVAGSSEARDLYRKRGQETKSNRFMFDVAPQEAPKGEVTTKPAAVEAPKTAEPVAPQVSEPVPVESQKPPEPPLSTTSARKDQLAADRAELDLPELPQAERKGWRTSLINAKEKGLDQRAERLADQVLANPRALDDEQTAGMVLKLQQLKNEHAELLDKIATESDTDQIAQHRADLESVEQSFDKITEAVKKSGSEKGRSLASQKLTINQDFDLVSMLNRYKAKTGKEPTPEIRAQIESQQKRIADLEKQLTEKSVKSGTDRIAREVRRENRQRTRKVLDEEAATIKTNLAAEFARLKSQSTAGQFKSQSGLGALDPDGVITKNALKYAKNRFEAGLTDASQLVDDVHKVLSEFADVTKRQVAEMISGYGGLKPRETKEQLEKTLADLRKEMRDALRQADVDAGKIAVRPEGPKLSEGVGQRQGPSLGPKQGPTLREGVGKKEGPALGPKQGPRLREGFRQLEGPRLSEGIGRKEGPSLGPKQGPPETKPQIQKRFQKQINEIERRIREQDFAPKAKRGPTVLDSDTQKIQVELERAKQNFQRKLREWQSSQRTRTEKVADLAVNWSRAAKLMYVSTLGKLSSAATGRMVMSPIENLIGEIPHRLSPELSRRATTEGGGFNRAAEVAALWKSGRFRQVLDQLTKGSSDLDVLLGNTKSIDKEMSRGGLLGIPGRVHGAFKEYPRQAEFDRAFVKVLRNYDQQGRDITRPDVQLAARMEAFNSAERARFQQRNIISDGFNNLMGWFERQGGLGKGIGKGGRFIFPITRVPVNVVGETANYTFGLPRAAVEQMWRNVRGTMTPEKADNIMRAYKKGGIGLAVMTYAFLNPKQFGGYYQKGDKRDPNEPQPGEVMFFGKRIPKVLTHVPILEAAQLAATARRVMDRMTEQGKSDAVIEGGIAAGKGLAEQVPFYETPARFFTGKEGARGVAELAGEQTRGMIPGFIQEAAKVTDKDKEGEPIPRAPQGGFAQRFAQTVKMGVPGLRQQVPINERKVSQQRKAGFQERFMQGKITETDLDRAAKKSELTQSDINSILEEKDLKQQYNPTQLAFYKTPTLTPNKTSTALDRYERMTPRMQADVKEIMQEKADAILDSDALTEEQKKTFADRIKNVGLLVRGWKEEK